MKPRDNLTFRNIAELRKSPSSTRVLDLLEQHTKVHRAGGVGKKFFDNDNLNRTIIIKHRLRPYETYIFAHTRTIATKVFLPFNPTSLRDGGRSFFIREEGWREILRDHFSLDAVHPTPEVERDLRLLELVDGLPSLDPFILREKTRLDGIEVDPEFFEISSAEYERIRKVVEAEFFALARLAFEDGENVPARAKNLVMKMWDARNADGMMPLIKALRIVPAEAAGVLFAWKGFIYYKSALKGFKDSFSNFMSDMRRINIVGYADPGQRDELADMKAEVMKSLIEAYKTISEGVAEYDERFRGGLLDRRNPLEFRGFLEQSPKYFLEVGAALAAVNHAVSFWRYRFAQQKTKYCSADEFFEILRDFGEGTGAA